MTPRAQRRFWNQGRSLNSGRQISRRIVWRGPSRGPRDRRRRIMFAQYTPLKQKTNNGKRPTPLSSPSRNLQRAERSGNHRSTVNLAKFRFPPLGLSALEHFQIDVFDHAFDALPKSEHMRCYQMCFQIT